MNTHGTIRISFRSITCSTCYLFVCLDWLIFSWFVIKTEFPVVIKILIGGLSQESKCRASILSYEGDVEGMLQNEV